MISDLETGSDVQAMAHFASSTKVEAILHESLCRSRELGALLPLKGRQ